MNRMLNRFRFSVAFIILALSIVLAWSRFAVAQSAAESPNVDRVRLSSGEILNVEILERTADHVRFRHPVLGEMTLPTSAMEILPPAQLERAISEGEDASEPETPAGQQEDAAGEASSSAPPAAAPAETEPPREWKFRLTLAGASVSGNTESTNISTIFTAERETPRIKTAIDASYFYGSEDGDTTENRFSTGFRHDWLNPGSKWFYFVDGRYDFDKFQSWDHRVQSHVGIGYHLIEPPKLKLDLLAGLGAIKEWGSNNDNVRPEGLLGVDGEYTFAEAHSLSFSSTLYPDLSNVEDFRWVNDVAWVWEIDQETDLALTAGLQHEYQSEVDPGRDRNDLRVYAGVQLDF